MGADDEAEGVAARKNESASSRPQPFPRGTGLPTQSPLFWVDQKDRYLRQLLIRDIEAITGRRLVVYFVNRFLGAQIDGTDPTYVVEMLEDTSGSAVDVLLETGGGLTDATEAVISVLHHMTTDLRVVVAGAAKSNGTVICLAGRSIVMGPASELGPIEPQVGQIPCSILATPQIAQQNFVLHQAGVFAIEQTRKLATQLLTKGMMKGKSEEEITAVVNKLLTRDTYFSHGSVIDHEEASSLGLAIEYLPPENDLWQRFRLLACMYEYDCRRNNFLKIFEGAVRSSAIEAPVSAGPQAQGQPPQQ